MRDGAEKKTGGLHFITEFRFETGLGMQAFREEAFRGLHRRNDPGFWPGPRYSESKPERRNTPVRMLFQLMKVVSSFIGTIVVRIQFRKER